MIDITLALMTGTDIPIEECQLIMHQPTLKEISVIGEKNFFIGIQSLCIDKSMVTLSQLDSNNVSNEFNNFTLMMSLCKQDVTKKYAIQDILTILFPKYKIVFTPRSLCFTSEQGTLITIDEQNFEALQYIVRKVLCLTQSGNDGFNPNKNNKKAMEIANKLMKARQRVSEIKARENQDGEYSLAQYISIITVGIPSMSLQDAISLTIYQLYTLMERYSLYVNWDLDIRSRLAGGKPETKTESWMKNIH